jgi:Spy/CpxP family protein refolding chaperone
MKSLAICFVLAAFVVAARADDHGTPPHHPPPDTIHDKLFPPELIMAHQKDLGVDDKQRDAIIKDVEKTQKDVMEMSWKMSAAAEELGKLLEPGKVDEAKALAAADRVMNLERDIKKAHLSLLVRIKNGLTDAQRAKLVELRKQASGGPPPHP